MIDETILYLPQTDCSNTKLKPFVKELSINVNWDPDLHLGVPLSKIFSRVVRFDVGETYAKDGVIYTNKKIIELVNKHSPKYVIWPTMTYEVSEETFQKVRKLGVYVIGWFFDDETRFENYSRWWIPYMDYIFTSDKLSVRYYQQFGAKAYHLPVAGEPDDFKPLKGKTSYELSFVGSRYVADREDMIKRFDNDGVSISTFGKGWVNGFVSHEEMVQIFFNSKINLCFTKSCVGKRNQLKGKIFDITMYGGFLLCEYVEGIEDFFEIGKEIVCFNNYAEALEKIKYFLKNDDERKRIAEAGKIRATRDLAQHKLLEKVFTAVEIDTGVKAGRNLAPVSVLQMPKYILEIHAQYHLRWATVLKKVGFDKKFWQDEYNLACRYAPAFVRLNFIYRNIARIVYLIEGVKRKVRIRIRV